MLMVRWVLICALASGRLLSAADLKTEFHEYFQQACQAKGFMGVASVTVEGETKFQEACGWQTLNGKSKIPLTRSSGRDRLRSSLPPPAFCCCMSKANCHFMIRLENS